MTDIRTQTEHIRTQLRRIGRYRQLAGDGLTYHWIQKFACGVINNPTVDNLAKLEAVIRRHEADADDAA